MQRQGEEQGNVAPQFNAYLPLQSLILLPKECTRITLQDGTHKRC